MSSSRGSKEYLHPSGNPLFDSCGLVTKVEPKCDRMASEGRSLQILEPERIVENGDTSADCYSPFGLKPGLWVVFLLELGITQLGVMRLFELWIRLYMIDRSQKRFQHGWD
jgi:hypothetical protein